MSSGFEWCGDFYADAIEAAVERALLECGEDLRGKSLQEAPIDTGDLRNAAVVDPSELHGEEMTLKVGYTAEVDAYSVIQHERLDFNHPNGGKAKYLEDPLNANKDRYAQYIGKAVGEATRK